MFGCRGSGVAITGKFWNHSLQVLESICHLEFTVVIWVNDLSGWTWSLVLKRILPLFEWHVPPASPDTFQPSSWFESKCLRPIFSSRLGPAYVNSRGSECFLNGSQLIIFILSWITYSNVRVFKLLRKPTYFYLVIKTTTWHNKRELCSGTHI